MFEQEMESSSTSEIFNLTDGDVTIYSSDLVQFLWVTCIRLHELEADICNTKSNVKFKLRSDLLRQSSVFDDMMTVGKVEPIILTELGSEIEIMLQWMHPKWMDANAKAALNSTWFWRMCDKYDLSLIALMICTELRWVMFYWMQIMSWSSANV